MAQTFKSVYFSDYRQVQNGGQCLTLAFGKKDADLYQRIRPLSSCEVRELLGHLTFEEVKAAAERERLSVNTYCLRQLDTQAEWQVREPGQLYLTNVYVDPVHATFKGGQAEALHSWYPLLEGYSPQFVRQILEEYAPSAKRVFDPFAGMGTSPLTAARMGLESFFCEVNPLCQHLIQVKIAALTMNAKARARVLALLSEWSVKVEEWLDRGPADDRLAVAYKTAFGSSEFFTPDVFEQVLRARTLVDDLACHNPAAADLLATAVVASLVPASLMKRAGDLRYKTEKELAKGAVPFAELIEQRLTKIISDLTTLEYVDRRPILVCEDAKHLGTLPAYGFDCVVSSPPYLNGTNYFRNTRLELWFLKCLGKKADLANFRERAVTAGINGVSRSKELLTEDKAVARIVEELSAKAYDARIPRMVGSYFHDMARVADGMAKHLAPGACVAIDIGDSAYAGVHVPTDSILISILAKRGFELLSRTDLRKRVSRDRTALRQVLLIFSYEPPAKGRREPVPQSHTQPPWRKRWEDFKRNLPHQMPPYSKRNWGNPLHSLCSYQGKMKPALAHHLVGVFLEPPAAVLDPFAGVGTIPFEAGLQGVRSYGFEISPAAHVIAVGKCGVPDPAECDRAMDELEDFIQREKPTAQEQEAAQAVAFNSRVTDYYEPQTLREVLSARRFFLEHPPRDDSQAFVVASLLHLLHGNRPYALSRRSHNTTPFAPKGDFEYRPVMPRLRKKVSRGLSASRPPCFERGQIAFQDATTWWPQEVRELDAVITSPPFFGSTRFHLANWLRLWFCGWELDDFRSKPMGFVEEKQKESFATYESIFRQARERLKPGGIVVMHLGKSRKCDMAAELSQIAAKWFEVADVFDESVRHCERHGVRDKGTVSSHQYLVLT